MIYQQIFLTAHGCLMTISWGIFIVTGVLFARHFRGYETTYCGLKMWFSMHRALNTVGLIGIVLALISIVIAKGTWTGPWFGMESMSPGTWHSLIGSVAIFLAVIQPINALFRCKEGSRKRKRFTWAHRMIGLLAFLLAMAAMLIATISFKSVYIQSGVAMGVWITYLVILFTCMSAKGLTSYKEWKKSKSAPADKIVFESDCAKKTKFIILVVFEASAIGLSLLLCILMIVKTLSLTQN